MERAIRSSSPSFYEHFFSESVRRAAAYPPPGSWMPGTSPNCVQLQWGYAFPESLPMAELLVASQELFRQEADLPLQYGGSQALGRLNGLLEQLCERRDITDGVLLVTCGSLQALEIVARVLLDGKEAIAVESPTYMAALEIFRAYTSNILSYPVDQDGLVVDALRADLVHRRQNGSLLPKVIYVMPTFHNPMGIRMSQQRKTALLALADEFDMLILEDDAYNELYFTTPTSSLKSLDRDGRVIYLGSLSKTVAPGVRLGWAFGPAPIINAIKVFNTARTNPMSWAITAHYLETVDYEKRLKWLRTQYAARCAFMLQCLAKYMPNGISWTQPQGGYFVWVTLPEGMDSASLLPAAIEAGVAYVPGQYFYANPEEGRRHLRLSFSWLPLTDISRGIEALGFMLTSKAKRPT